MTCVKTIMIASTLAAATLSPLSANAQTLELIYRVAGVRDSGSAANVGIATAFICSNYNNQDEDLRIRIFTSNGTVVADETFSVSSNATFNASTHNTIPYLR